MRLFVAIELPDGVRAALGREQDRLRSLCAPGRQIRWTAPLSLHLTLKFLGETAPERGPAAIAALEALSPFPPFELAVRGFGFFPDARRPQVFWAGFDAPPALQELARQVNEALGSLGFSTDHRPFAPHLTLARLRTPRADPALLAAMKTPPGISVGSFAVEEYFLFESHLLPGGAKHTKLARFPPL